jgi:hypothetical protein
MKAHCNIRAKQSNTLLQTREHSPEVRITIDDGLDREDCSTLDKIKIMIRKLSYTANFNSAIKQLILRSKYMLHHHYLFPISEIDSILDVLKKEYAYICKQEIRDNSLLFIQPGIDERFDKRISQKIKNRAIIRREALHQMFPSKSSIYNIQKSIQNISQYNIGSTRALLQIENDPKRSINYQPTTQRQHKRNATDLYKLPLLSGSKAKLSSIQQSEKHLPTLHKLYGSNQSMRQSIKLILPPTSIMQDYTKPAEESTQTGRWNIPNEEPDYDITVFTNQKR